MSEDFDEILDLASDEELKALEGEPEAETPEEGQGEPETEQNRADFEPEMDAEAAEIDEEGPDTGEPESEPVEAKTDVQISDLMAKLEGLEKSNSGLYHELKEERDRRKALMDELKQRAEAEEAAKRKSEAPDKDEDPAGYLEAQIRTLREEQAAWRKHQEEASQQQAQAQAYHQAEYTVGQLEDHFRQQHQDYDEALNFARNERARLLRATHPDQPDEWVANMIAQGDRMFALQSLQQGVDPAQRAYDYAVRLGYKAGEGNGNTGQAAPAAATSQSNLPVQPKAKPKSTSLSATAGRSGGKGQKITYEQFAGLDTDNAEDRELFDRIAGNEFLARQIEEQGYVHL